MRKIKIKELKNILAWNSTRFLHVHAPCTPDVSYKLSVHGFYDENDQSLGEYFIKYPVFVDWSKPFSSEVLVAEVAGLLDFTWPSAIGQPRFIEKSGGDSVIPATPENLKSEELKLISANNKLKHEALLLKDKLTFGFELETEETEGITSPQYCDDYHVEETEDEHWEDQKDTIQNFIKSRVNPDNLVSYLKRVPAGRRCANIELILNWHYSSIFKDRPLDITQANVDTILTELFKASGLDMSLWFNLDPRIDVKKDQSVDGFEFATVGGHSINDFNAMAREVFSLGHDIRSECSFHIHVGNIGDTLKYFEPLEIQRRIISYVVSDDRVPTSVLERWEDPGARRFFDHELCGVKRKQVFIRIHPQGTLEFRCFGNIQTAEEAEICRQIAQDAVVDALTTSPDKSLTGFDWEREVHDALSGGESAYLRDYSGYLSALELLKTEFDERKQQLKQV